MIFGGVCGAANSSNTNPGVIMGHLCDQCDFLPEWLIETEGGYFDPSSTLAVAVGLSCGMVFVNHVIKAIIRGMTERPPWLQALGLIRFLPRPARALLEDTLRKELGPDMPPILKTSKEQEEEARSKMISHQTVLTIAHRKKRAKEVAERYTFQLIVLITVHREKREKDTAAARYTFTPLVAVTCE